MAVEHDYFLGTDDEELKRLGIQHRVWRPMVLDCWRRAGIGPGQTVLDVGAGPGYAARDLAELVGPTGTVVALERSARFVEAGRRACAERGLTQVQYHQIDLMADAFPVKSVDATWCRWVAAFVSSPRALVRKLSVVVRPGGVAVFHEYCNYASWKLAPRRLRIEEFVSHVMANWRESGGEPDIALDLPRHLADAGFRLREAVPRIYCLKVTDEMWRWPSSFVNLHLDRLLELGRVSPEWVAAARDEFQVAEADPTSLMLTPTVLEIIAERI